MDIDEETRAAVNEAMLNHFRALGHHVRLTKINDRGTIPEHKIFESYMSGDIASVFPKWENHSRS